MTPIRFHIISIYRRKIVSTWCVLFLQVLFLCRKKRLSAARDVEFTLYCIWGRCARAGSRDWVLAWTQPVGEIKGVHQGGWLDLMFSFQWTKYTWVSLNYGQFDYINISHQSRRNICIYMTCSYMWSLSMSWCVQNRVVKIFGVPRNITLICFIHVGHSHHKHTQRWIRMELFKSSLNI